MKNILNKWMALAACLMALVLTAGTLPVTAAQSDTPTGTQEGTTIAILGADLTQEQHDALLKEFGASAQTKILTVTNEEEHQALDGVIPDEQIGTDAISSVMITFKKKGSGLNLHMTHITYVTPQSYADALTTLGITDADIQISAPFDVSGTAALTGIMKGYEDATGQTIDDDVKNAVNEEAVTTTELTNDLAEKMGTEEAEKAVTNIINNIKIEINNQNPQSEEEVEARSEYGEEKNEKDPHQVGCQMPAGADDIQDDQDADQAEDPCNPAGDPAEPVEEGIDQQAFPENRDEHHGGAVKKKLADFHGWILSYFSPALISTS